MTVPATPRRAGPYDGTGAQTAFPFSFKAFDESDVRVVELDEPTNVETDAVLNSDYTVTLNPDQESTPGGTVNYLVAPSTDKKITLIGDLDFAQPVDLPDGGNYRAQQVEDALDRLAICMQQLKEITDRCAQIPVSSTDASSLIDSINTLSANLPTLQIVVTNIADLVALAADIADVNTLAAISAQIQTVAAIAIQVVAVATISAEVVAVDGISADVQIVAANMASILAAVADLPALAGKANSGAIGASLLTMATARFLGRITAGSGAIEELTAAQMVAQLRSSTVQAQAGTDNDTLLTPLRLKEAQLLPANAVTLTNQTAVDFTGIPSWAKRVTVTFSGVSTNGTANPVIQIGDSGGVENSGYLGSSSSMDSAVASTGYGAGFGLRSAGAGNVLNGSLVLDWQAGNTWVARGVFAGSNAAFTIITAGAKQLSAALDRIRLTTGNGTDQYDAGVVNIVWE